MHTRGSLTNAVTPASVRIVFTVGVIVGVASVRIVFTVVVIVVSI